MTTEIKSHLFSLEDQKIHFLLLAEYILIFEAEVTGTAEIKYWVMCWGSKAEVLEPESLRKEILAESELMVRADAKGVEAVEKTLLA